MDQINITPYTSRVWDEHILSYLDINSEGRVVTAEKWVALWTMNFNFIKTVDKHLDELIGSQGAIPTLLADYTELRANVATLDEKLYWTDYTLKGVVNDAALLRNAVSQINDQLNNYITHNDVDLDYNPESANPQSGKAVFEAIAPVHEKANDACVNALKALDRLENNYYVDQKYNASSLRAQSGKAVAAAIHPVQARADDAFAKAENALNQLEYNLCVDQGYNALSPKAQSGTAVAEAIKNGAENIDYSVPWYAPAETLKDTLDAMANNVLGLASHAITDDKLDVLKVPEQALTDHIPTSYAVRATIDAIVGDIEAALDSIIDIQNKLIGGAE